MSGLSAPIRAYAPMHYSGAAAPFSFASFWGNRPETVSQTTHILARARAQGKKLGRPRRDTPKRLAAIRKLRKRGIGINKIASKLGIGVSVVQRVLSGKP
jgi:hypothetical protein